MINLKKVCFEILSEMYKESEPKADFNQLYKTGETKKQEWFMKYYLDDKRQQEILDKICSKHKLSSWQKQGVEEFIFLGPAPNSCRKTWEKLQEDK